MAPAAAPTNAVRLRWSRPLAALITLALLALQLGLGMSPAAAATDNLLSGVKMNGSTLVVGASTGSTLYGGFDGAVSARRAGDEESFFGCCAPGLTPDNATQFGIRIGGNVYGYQANGSPFTRVSAPQPSGQGTANSPWVITSQYGVPHLLRVTQHVRHVNGTDYFDIEYSIDNLSGFTLEYDAYHATDLYLPDPEDPGYPGQSATAEYADTGGVARLITTMEDGTKFTLAEGPGGERWRHHYAGEFGTAMAPLSDAYESYSDRIEAADDLGVGVSWDVYSPSDVIPNVLRVRWSLAEAVPATPSKVQALAAAPDNSSAVLRFSPPATGPEPTGYEYALGNSNSWSALTTSPDNGSLRATIPNLVNGTPYTVRVRAKSNDGPGAEESVQVTPADYPDAPHDVTVTAGNGQVSITFIGGADGGSTVTKYQVRLNPTEEWQDVTLEYPEGGGLLVTIPDLPNGQTYTPQLRAVNARGPGPATDIPPAVTTGGPPAAPTDLEAEAGDQSVLLRFGAPQQTNGFGITGYEYSSDGGDTYATLTTEEDGQLLRGTVSQQSANSAALVNGTPYQFRVRARNAKGAWDPASISATPFRAADAPTAVSVVGQNGAAVLTFTPPADLGGSDLVRYEAQTSEDGPWAEVVTQAADAGNRVALFDDLENGRTYSLRLRAVTQRGPGVGSEAQSVVPATVPGAVTGLTSEPADASAVLTFTPPASNGGAEISAYQYSRNAGQSWDPLVTSPYGNGQRRGTVAGLENGQGYTILVRAENRVGPADTRSTEVTPATVPAEPVVSSVVSGNGSASLTFPTPANGGAQITRYEGRANGGNWVTVSSIVNGPNTVVTFPSLDNGTQYALEVRAVNARGEGPASSPQTVTPSTTPGYPTGFDATPANNSALVSFLPPQSDGGAPVTYEYDVSGSQNWVTLNTTPGENGRLTGTVSPLVNGTPVMITLRARNIKGVSDPVFDSVTPGAAPDAPTGLTVAHEDRLGLITFTKPAGNGSEITRYDARRNGGQWLPVQTWETDEPNRILVRFPDLTNGVAYTFALRAVNNRGEGPSSEVVSLTPSIVPDNPRDLSFTPGNGSVVVHFLPPSSDGGDAMTYQYQLNNGGWVDVTPTPDGDDGLKFTVPNLQNGTGYVVFVRARNVNGPGTPDLAQVRPSAIPGAPVAVSALSDNESAAVIFTEPATNGAEITQYQGRINNTGDWFGVNIDRSNDMVWANFGGLTNGSEYSLQLRAVNARGEGPASNAVTVTPATTPSAPTGFEVVRGNQSLTLNWNVPESSGGATVSTYEVSIDGGDHFSVITPTPLQGGGFTYVIPDLTNGTPYSVVLRGRNSAGAGEPTSVIARTPAAAPGIPTDASVLSQDASAWLSFTPGAFNGSDGEYQVRLGADGEWVATTPVEGQSDPTRIILSDLTNGTPYDVYLRQANDVGPGPAVGPLTVTPVGPAGAPQDFTVSSGDAQLELSWRAPATTGGSPITGYQVTQDGGHTWTDLTVPPAVNGVLSASVPGLTNETAYTVAIRAVTSFEPGGTPSESVTSTPYAAPTATGTVSAVGGTSSITASWSAATQPNRVAGYLAYAQPGPSFCETDSATATSCVLGAEIGKPYRVVVVTKGVNGSRSAEFGPSNQVTITPPPVPSVPPAPDPDLTLTTDQGDIEQAAPGQQITIVGTGFAPYSTIRVIIYSAPQVLATVTTDFEGKFSVPVTVPPSLAVGEHTFVASGVSPDGEVRALTLPVVVPAAAAPPEPANLRSTGTGTAQQSRQVTVPAGGSVRLLNAQGNPVTKLTVPGKGTFTAAPLAGKLVFDPVLGFSGTVAVKYRVTDADDQTGDATWTVTVKKPAKPTAPGLGGSGAKPAANAPVASGGTTTLLDADGKPATTATVPGQGTYAIDAKGHISFTPVAGFTGTPTPVRYRVTDAYGQTADGTYAPTVPTRTTMPKTGGSPAGLLSAALLLLLTGMALRVAVWRRRHPGQGVR